MESFRVRVGSMVILFLLLSASAAPAVPAAPSADVVLQLGQLPAADRSVVLRTAGIVGRQITQRCNATVAQPGNGASGAIVIELRIDASLGGEGYSIAAGGAGGSSVVIAGGDSRGVIFGAGKFLRSSRYDGPAAAPFTPGRWRGTGAPQLRGSFRAHYFATHFSNFYQAAPLAEVSDYLEDIALWGVNTLIVAMCGPGTSPHGDGASPAPDDVWLAPCWNRTRELLRLAREIGLSPGVVFAPNLGFDSGHAGHHTGHSPVPYTPFPDPQGVRGHFGALSCGFKGEKYLVGIRRQAFLKLKDIGLDWIVSWPYDDGGCGCDEDWPWGGKGFPRLSSKMAVEARSVFPTLKMVVSTWCFDTPVVNSSEYEGMDAFIKREITASGGASNFSFAMVDDHGDFPRWPLDHGGGRVGGLPLLNFPEISMWGRGPWGGWGANPLPNRFEGLWLQTQGKVVGGMPYSEGIYEDMNGAVAWAHYWAAGANANDTLREYVAFEFSAELADVADVMTAIGMLEKTWPSGAIKQPGVAALATDAFALISKVRRLCRLRRKHQDQK